MSSTRSSNSRSRCYRSPPPPRYNPRRRRWRYQQITSLTHNPSGVSLRNTLPASFLQEQIPKIGRGCGSIREFQASTTINGGSMEEEGCRRSWNQSLLEGYDEGSGVGLWDITHLIPSVLLSYCMNAVIHHLYLSALSLHRTSSTS